MLFGGAAGGGKSDALLMAALQYVDVPGYSAILLRRKFTDLSQPGALIPRSHEWLAKTDAKYNVQLHEYKFPTGSIPATLKYGYIDSVNDVYQFQGAEFQFVGLDELTQFEQFPFDYMKSRLRRLKNFPVPLRMRASANPGGIGHEWVKAHFMDNAAQTGALFVPSRLEDNPSLDREEYEKSLAAIADPFAAPSHRFRMACNSSSVMLPSLVGVSSAYNRLPDKRNRRHRNRRAPSGSAHSGDAHR